MVPWRTSRGLAAVAVALAVAGTALIALGTPSSSAALGVWRPGPTAQRPVARALPARRLCRRAAGGCAAGGGSWG